MENKILEIAKKCFNTNNIKIEFRLLGGMSNYTYVIKNYDDNNLYTVRILGEYAEKFVDRNVELIGINEFSKLGLTNETVYFNLENGEKISKYIEGSPLTESTIDYEKVSELMKKYHNSNEDINVSYDAFNRLNNYENHLIELGYTLPNEYLDIRNKFLDYKEYLESFKKVLCHNDSQPSNFVLKNDGKLMIVDFEFVGMNDLLYDIACFGNRTMDEANKLLDVYFKNETESNKKELYKRMYLWRTYQCLQWFNVAMFKELVGMSKTLCLDFKAIAEFYINEANNNYNKSLKY